MIRLPHRTRLILAVSFCVLLSAGVLAIVLAPNRPADDGLPVTSGMPASAVGYSALAALLRAQGIPVTYAPIDEGNLHHQRGLVIIAPVSPRIPFPVSNTHLSAHILYVPPKWRLRHDPNNPDWIRSPGVLTDASAIRGLNLNIPSSMFFHMSEGADIHWWIDPRRYGLLGLPEPGPINRLRSFNGMRMPGMLGVGNEHMVLLGSGPFLLLSDPDFLDNLGMADQRTAVMAVRLIDKLRSNGPVWIAPAFIVTLSGGRARPLSLIFRSPFLAATVCMIVAAILMAWQGLVRFGPLRPATQPFLSGKPGLIESAAGLIERTRRTQHLSPSYAALMRDLALEARSGDPDRLLRQMQTKHRTTDDFFRLEQRAQAVNTQSDLLDVACALRLWKQEMTHGRK